MDRLLIICLFSDGQQVIGFECDGLRSDLSKENWRGLEFYNSTVELRKNGNNRMYEPLSWLEYVDISYAGRDINRGDPNNVVYARASISASPYVPFMNNITITNGAYDGLNLTELRGRIHIANSTISHNRGEFGLLDWNLCKLHGSIENFQELSKDHLDKISRSWGERSRSRAPK